jgi:hypothetical protein
MSSRAQESKVKSQESRVKSQEPRVKESRGARKMQRVEVSDRNERRPGDSGCMYSSERTYLAAATEVIDMIKTVQDSSTE